MSHVYYVVDSGVLFSPWKIDIKDAKLVTTSSIITEIRNRPSKTRAEMLQLLERMLTMNPSKEHVDQVKAAATRSGDISVISENDIDLVALAFMLDEEGGNKVVLVSTDFAVLNIASHLKLNILDPSKKFGQEITWRMSCPACHYKSRGQTRETECPICGTELRRSPLKKRRIRES